MRCGTQTTDTMRGREKACVASTLDSDDVVDMIKELKDITPSTLAALQAHHHEKITLKLKVEPEEFAELEELFDGETLPAFEYFAQSKEVIVLPPPTPIHQSLQSALEGWFKDVGEELSDAHQSVCPVNGCEISLAEGSTKIPDLSLATTTPGKFPIVAVEIGFAETMDKLYRDAELLLHGSKGRIDLVILLKATETDRHHKSEYPWGESPERLEAMEHEELIAAMEKHYAAHNLQLVGKLSVAVLLYPKGRKTRPKRAVFSFAHPSPGQTPQTAPKIAIKGRQFDFPVKEVQTALERGAAIEKTRRMLKHLTNARLLLSKG